MKYEIVLLVAFLAACLAAPATQKVEPAGEERAETLRLESENNGIDKYSFAYDTSNGISRTEEGELKTIDDNAAIVVHGSTSWTAPDGKKYEMVFHADETGYHPIFKLVA